MKDQYIRVSAEVARKQGIDWTSRSLFFPNRKNAIELLEKLLEDLKGTRDENVGR